MTQQPEQRKPKWLRKMEQESWQPELIISGAAILGSLQLPGLLMQFENYCLLNFDRDTLFIAYVTVVYWRLLATGLIFTFIFHFIVRALWIGLIGLNSVYPGGFKTNDKFSAHYQEHMREAYGDIDGFIQRLDRLGSGIFGVAFGIAGVFVNFGLVGLGLVFVHSWLMGMGLDPRQILLLIACVLSPLLLISVLVMLSHTRRFRDTPFVRRYQWPVAMLISRFTYPVARRYITTSTNLVTSYYADSKAFVLYFAGGMVLIIVVGMATMLTDDNVPFFLDRVYHRMANDSTRVMDAYPEEGDYTGIYYRPELDESVSVSDSVLAVWIPLPDRETAFMYANCSVAEVDKDLPPEQRNPRERARTLACAREYLSLQLNGRPIERFDLRRQYRHNEAGKQFGVLAYIAQAPLVEGPNLLRVTAKYPEEESGEPRISYLTFYSQE
ncbi:hypothetical protein CLV84_3368 [Neolewinella xylanilytica]|uniref:Uncharacterized protein n=1 Tax=Neolewinella xylanilytica TaxID=1514080 RepID=A0A2S6I5R7_9BACT|nr:hypothetical protein [Neolewinella xylanilytica]PPK86441.1 hypothetical protein CLV84_3368 [Neolewinella xylanilytica]